MTDFRHVCGLRTYSGGTVSDLNRISYSLLSPNDISSTQFYPTVFIIATGKIVVNTNHFSIHAAGFCRFSKNIGAAFVFQNCHLFPKKLIAGSL